MRQTVRAAATLAIVALLAAACGSSGSNNSSSSSSPSSSSSGGSSAAKFTGCMVTDTGGIDDKSFNASSWQGMQEAQSAQPSKVTVKYLQSTSSADYASNISAFLGQKCGIIVTVGFLMAGATGTAASVQPVGQVRHRGLRHRLRVLPDQRLGQAEHTTHERGLAGVQHRAGRLPRRLPGRGHDQDRQGGHVRRRRSCPP